MTEPRVDIPMATSRYRAVHDFNKLVVPNGAVRGFIPVKTSVGNPRVIPEAKYWPRASLFAP